MGLFKDLPDEWLREIIGGARRRRFARREVLFHEGDPMPPHPYVGVPGTPSGHGGIMHHHLWW
jgi:hypothetical protein